MKKLIAPIEQKIKTENLSPVYLGTICLVQLPLVWYRIHFISERWLPIIKKILKPKKNSPSKIKKKKKKKKKQNTHRNYTNHPKKLDYSAV